jgi:hypothetical protein
MPVIVAYTQHLDFGRFKAERAGEGRHGFAP